MRTHAILPPPRLFRFKWDSPGGAHRDVIDAVAALHRRHFYERTARGSDFRHKEANCTQEAMDEIFRRLLNWVGSQSRTSNLATRRRYLPGDHCEFT